MVLKYGGPVCHSDLGDFFLPVVFIPNRLMALFTPEPELIRIGAEYLRIVGFSYLFAGVSQCYLMMMMKVSGHAKLSVWISAITVIVCTQ